MPVAVLDRVAVLRQAKLFRSFTEPELVDLSQQSVVRRLRRDEPLVFEGETASGLFVLAEGSVRLFREGSDGREQVLRIEYPVTTLSELHLFDGGPHPASIAACDDSLVLWFPFPYCRGKLFQSPRFAADALELLSERLRVSFDLVRSLALSGVDERLAQYLLFQAHHHGRRKGDVIYVQLTQSNQQIGSVIGAVREVVSRSMAKLRKEGLIAFKGRTVLIPSQEALTRFAAGKGRSTERTLKAAAG